MDHMQALKNNNNKTAYYFDIKGPAERERETPKIIEVIKKKKGVGWGGGG